MTEKSSPAVNLSKRQYQFVLNYIKTGKIRDSAISAGYSKTSAATVGSRLLRKDKIIQAIESLRADVKSRELVSVEFVISELKKIAQDPAAQNRDKVSALTQLGRFLGIFVDKFQDISLDQLEAYAAKAGIELEDLRSEIDQVKDELRLRTSSKSGLKLAG